jgi:type IV pilus assembly protein PilC
MATTATKKLVHFTWKGKNRDGKSLFGEIPAGSKAEAEASLRRQGVMVTKITKKAAPLFGSQKIKEVDVVMFTRQLATMMRAGLPMLQAFDICARGHSNPSMTELLNKIKGDIESGSSLGDSFAKHPDHFDHLFCSLVSAGEVGGVLELLLNRLATYQEKLMAIKRKIKSAMTYPLAIIVVAFIATAVIMIFAIPTFAELFESFGKELPWITQVIVDMSNAFVDYWWLIFGVFFAIPYFFMKLMKKSETFKHKVESLLLRTPVFGKLLHKSAVARWARTLATMFAAGIPLVEALDSVAGAAGNHVYENATKKIRDEVSGGVSLTVAMSQQNKLFDNMVLQMVAIGEESGSLDGMLDKIAEFYEEEVDALVNSIASLIEPVILVFLALLIGTIVVAMYLPIFQLGDVVGG